MSSLGVWCQTEAGNEQRQRRQDGRGGRGCEGLYSFTWLSHLAVTCRVAKWRCLSELCVVIDELILLTGTFLMADSIGLFRHGRFIMAVREATRDTGVIDMSGLTC